MQTSANHPLDLNDRGQGVDRSTPSDPDTYHERINRLQWSVDRAVAIRRGYVLCPAPAGNNDRQDDYRLGMAHGYRTGLDWDGMSPEGVAYAGGADMGRFWRLPAVAG